jgi:hypothetical protein
MTALALDTSSLGDSFVLDDVSWEDSSSEMFEYAERKARLRSFVDSMIDEAPSWNSEPVFVSEQAVATAQAFLRLLPNNRRLPVVAAEGDGGLLFVWEPPNGNCILVVEQNLLHLLDEPGTRSVAHIENERFLGTYIPPVILDRVPLK